MAPVTNQKNHEDSGPVSYDYTDILIVGAGPAGTAAALSLAERGYRPALIDQNAFPRDKICGDAVSREGLNIVESFGLKDAVEQKGRTCRKKEFYLPGNRCITVDTRAIVLSRKVFDNVLLTSAIRRGVNFSVKKFTGRVYAGSPGHRMPGSARKTSGLPAGRRPPFNKSSVSGNDVYTAEVLCSETKQIEHIAAPYIIIATGCQSDTAFSAMEPAEVSRPDQLACRGYYRADWPFTERTYFFLQELNPGYLWVFPAGNDVFNVGCGGKILRTRKLNLKQCLDGFVEKINTTYTCTGEWLQEPKNAFLRTNFSNLHALRKYPNIVVAGEAMGSTNPFSGGGIGKALTSGIIAADCIDSVLRSRNGNRPLRAVYAKAINKKMKPSYYTLFTIGNFFLTKTPLEQFMYNRVFKSRRSPDVIALILSRMISPDSLFTLKNILKYVFFK